MDGKDKHGITPVLAAIWEGHTSCVKYLLESVSKNIAFQSTFEIYFAF